MLITVYHTYCHCISSINNSQCEIFPSKIVVNRKSFGKRTSLYLIILSQYNWTCDSHFKKLVHSKWESRQTVTTRFVQLTFSGDERKPPLKEALLYFTNVSNKASIVCSEAFNPVFVQLLASCSTYTLPLCSAGMLFHTSLFSNVSNPSSPSAAKRIT